MKIALTICEYNPFHNGHLYSINQIKRELSPDLLCVIMSGNFTERGEIAIANKYKRARHAITAGADVVFELPTVFATAPAEIFAKGAVKLLSTLRGEKTLCFGIEKGSKSGLIATATALSRESKEFKTLVKNQLKTGVSLARAKHEALAILNPPDIDLDFTETPNNILGLEYTKAIVEGGFKMDVLPIIRQGAGYKDKDTVGNLGSAMAIREAIKKDKLNSVKKLVPDYVFKDLPKKLPDHGQITLYSLMATPKKQLKQIIDCTEGLENRIKAYLKECLTLEELLDKLATKRYTNTRLQRIATASLLGITESFTRDCLKGKLYLKVLAVKKDSLQAVTHLLGDTPFIMRKSDADKLEGVAKECFLKDAFANDVYSVITQEKNNEFYTEII